VTPRRHLAHRRVAHHQDGAHHDVQPALLVRDLRVAERRAEAEARVVDQQPHGVGLDPAQPLGHRLHLVAVREVSRENLDLHAGRRAQLRGQRLQPRRVPRHQHEVVPRRRQLPGELQAQAGGRARDESRTHDPSLGPGPRDGPADGGLPPSSSSPHPGHRAGDG